MALKALVKHAFARSTGIRGIQPIKLKKHPSEIPSLEADHVRKDTSGSGYFALFRPEIPEDRALFMELLTGGFLYYWLISHEWLMRLEMGFSSGEMANLLDDITATNNEYEKAKKTLEKLDFDLKTVIFNQQKNIVLDKVEELQIQVKKAKDKIIEKKEYFDTATRRIETIENRILLSIKKYRQEKVDDISKKLDPIVAEINEHMKEGIRLWQQAGVPLLRSIHEILPEVPADIHFGTPTVTVSQGRELKTFVIFPSIKKNRLGVYEFQWGKIE